MKNGFTKYQLNHALFSIEGYYLPRPHENTAEGRKAAFERAKAEAIAAYNRMIAALESTTYEQFAKRKESKNHANPTNTN